MKRTVQYVPFNSPWIDWLVEDGWHFDGIAGNHGFYCWLVWK